MAYGTTLSLKTSGSPSIIGVPVILTATLAGGVKAVPNGEQITFHNGATVLGTGSISNNVATLSVSTLAVGSYSLTAFYPGDSTYLPSTSPAVQQVVNRNTTTTTVSSSLNPATYSKAITFTAKVTSAGPTPTGTVTFKNGTTAFSTGTLSSGTATYTAPNGLPVGTSAITVSYAGDTYSGASVSGVLNQVVNPAPTTTSVVSSKNPGTLGQPVTFTATVSAGGPVPTGTVVFSSGSLNLGSATLSNGKASITTSSLPSGTDQVTAAYGGVTNFAASSGSYTETVH